MLICVSALFDLLIKEISFETVLVKIHFELLQKISLFTF